MFILSDIFSYLCGVFSMTPMTFMRKSRYIVILAAVVSVLTLTIACMDADHKDMLGTSKNGAHASHVPQPTDTLYTREVQRRSALEGRLLV